MNPPASTQPLTQWPTLVSSQMIPKDNDLASKMPQKITQKGNNLFLPDRAVHKELQVPSQTVTLWRDRQSADCRNTPVVPSPLPKNRRLAANCPCPPNQWLQQKSRFVNENQVSMPSFGSTLNPRPVMLQPTLDGCLVTLGCLALRLLRGKTKAKPSDVGSHLRDSARRNAAGSVERYVGRSIGRWQNQKPGPLLADTPLKLVFAESSALVDVLVGGVLQGLLCRRVGSVSANGTHFEGWSLGCGRFRQGHPPVVSRSRPASFAALTVPGFHLVSCFIISASYGY